MWYVSLRYYEGGVSSVYLWDLDHGFAGVILIKKGLKCILAWKLYSGIVGNYTELHTIYMYGKPILKIKCDIILISSVCRLYMYMLAVWIQTGKSWT